MNIASPNFSAPLHITIVINCLSKSIIQEKIFKRNNYDF